MMTGIGGQGIQLASEVLARAALAEGREVQLFGNYGGMMRGGSTEATLVMADRTIEAPPTVGQTWSAIVMHHEYSASTLSRLRNDSLVLVNGTVVGDGPRAVIPGVVFDVPATDLAVDIGNIMAASMVMIGAYAALTGIVTLHGLADAVALALPTYRMQHVALNVAALEAGWGAVDRDVVPAWVEALPA
jgi:Pyruvate/2-oxoacid:ferredoxin oxidoreductase gamma subunit